MKQGKASDRVALRIAGKLKDAIQGCKDALSLQADYAEAGVQLSELIQDVEQGSAAAFQGTGLSLGPDTEFPGFRSHTGGTVLVGVCTQQKHFAKIELIHHPDKLNTLEQEANIMAHLNERGCVSCPKFYTYGTIGAEDLLPFLDEEQRAILRITPNDVFPFIVQEYLSTGTRLNLADMILSFIEQKNLGVYHGDPKPRNLRIDADLGICYFVDYDQAELLDEEIMNLDNISFFNWCNERAKKRYGFSSFLDFFPNRHFHDHFMRYFRDGSFNIGTTTIFSRQQTTLAECGIYHALHEDSIYTDGERGIDDRRPLLDAIDFAPGERVLDIGCNAGLVSMYLHDRGCVVTGTDLDQSVIYGARFVANILRKDIHYECVDLDDGDILVEFDTVTLFSVLHHTRDVPGNGERIAGKCRRILIECRLKEDGAKPADGVWQATSNWQFDSVDDLVAMLESIFPDFELVKNYGMGDRDRYLLEFAKK